MPQQSRSNGSYSALQLSKQQDEDKSLSNQQTQFSGTKR